MLAVEKRTSAMTTASATKSGWRKPAVVGERTLSRKKTRDIANAFRCHGGLTPAALGNERLCIAKVAVLPADISHCNTKSGGRKPPVAPRNANARAIRTHTVGGLPTNSGRMYADAIFAGPRSMHGGLTPAALDARSPGLPEFYRAR
jgi:hypothetical protein